MSAQALAIRSVFLPAEEGGKKNTSLPLRTVPRSHTKHFHFYYFGQNLVIVPQLAPRETWKYIFYFGDPWAQEEIGGFFKGNRYSLTVSTIFAIFSLYACRCVICLFFTILLDVFMYLNMVPNCM